MSSFLWGILSGIIANAIFAIIVKTFARLPSSLSRRDPRRASDSIVVMLVTWPLLNVILFIIVTILEESVLFLIPIPISLITIAILFYMQLNQFWKVGIRGVDQNIGKGIDYKSALRLCKNELKFLGIGASKLTKEHEFIDALSRCVSDKPIKFLLLNPDDTRLVKAAKRFNRPFEEYKKNVITSLRKISEIKRDRDFNIEVRFYSTEPFFRLMFIDSSLCLFSYYELGKGDGSQLPQLHIVKADERKQKAESLYYPLEKYFDELWEDSIEWDFQNHTT
jgi:hypothetical protein